MRSMLSYSTESEGGRCSEIRTKLERADSQINAGEYGYALQDIRIGLEIGVKCILSHYASESEISKQLAENITTCENKRLLSSDFAKMLKKASAICNKELHDTREYNTHNQVRFAFHSLEDLCQEIEKYTCSDRSQDTFVG